ncbi:MAG: pyrroloquinoline quinone precursor peptide PqqA [Rhizobiaceae bacterium]|nr:pyrroloquinoline quinone precursor peptide PqqA [Rhizobiaceae bacterium]
MAWTKPEIIEVSCGMEISRYMPADDQEPILF